MKHNQRGMGTLGFIVCLAVVVGCGAFAGTIEGMKRAKSDFERHFGVYPPAISLSADQKAVLHPVVSRKLAELAKANQELEDFKHLPPAENAKQATERLLELDRINTALDTYQSALKLAKEFGFAVTP